MPPPLLIGLTGGIAAGKSEALAAFERLGAATVSSDVIVHELLDEPEVAGRLVERWGEEVAPEGKVDRSRVGTVVFEEPAELAWLERQVHPLVGEKIAAWLGSLPARTSVAVVEVPLLFEAEMAGSFDVTVAVVADDELRRSRAEERGHDLVEERAARQLHQDEKAARADHVVRNQGTLRELEQQVSDLLGKLAPPGEGPRSDLVQR